ncbi:membrane protein FxsA [Rhizobium sp. S95]|uniref:Membrane protein FxsA n=1 Tax=Ciceribacter sichuanensis TaxID=2949647 RepID=A0AAJ1BVU8_9HYPH|nr:MULTISPECIES: FxsA family protein [unclassified Ciceribacter]MCM2396553.1 membrane protein FxsA [Ciceribacter sp. S95]MCO5957296.1 membrane protein FxsA [Ciceribacter sp. S101]
MRVPLAILLLMPLAEIATFVLVGKAIGVLPTLGLTLLAVFVGLALLRIQGAGVLQRLQKESRTNANPGREIVHGAMIVVAAMLLIIPGFLTDILGILLFVPFVRDFIWSFIGPRVTVQRSSSFSYQGASTETSRPKDGPIIDLDEDDFRRDGNRQSPWSLEKDQ